MPLIDVLLSCPFKDKKGEGKHEDHADTMNQLFRLSRKKQKSLVILRGGFTDIDKLYAKLRTNLKPVISYAQNNRSIEETLDLVELVDTPVRS